MRGSMQFPFPDGDLKRAWLRFEQGPMHVQKLDPQLERPLRGMLDRSDEWHRHTAAPLLRIRLLDDYLRSLIRGSLTMTVRQRRRRRRIEAARDQSQSPLTAADTALLRLSDPTAGAEERLKVLDELPLYRIRQGFILVVLDDFMRQRVQGQSGRRALYG